MSYVRVTNRETGTTPTVIHANGMAKKAGKPFADSWPEIMRQFRASSPEQKPLRDDLTIVTWKGGKYTNTVTVLEESCEKFGVPIKLLPWPSHITAFWEASKAKAYETLKALKSGEINTKYVMAMDAGDVVFLKHPNDILEEHIKKFSSHKSSWCTEDNNWPRFDLPKYVHHPVLDDYVHKLTARDLKMAEDHGTRYRHMNVGCVIGESEHMIEFYETGMRICGDLPTNDQLMGRIAQYEHPDKHAMDCGCEIFQCLYNVGLETLTVETVDE